MQMMSVIGHDGTVYTLQRTDAYDGLYFWRDFSDVQAKLKQLAKEDKPDEYVSELMNFLKRSENYGTRFDRRRAQGTAGLY